ncbi:MAG: VirB4 family type IV secretion system protein [bacterium]
MLLNSVLKKININDSFNNYVNLLSIRQDIAVGIDGSYTAGFRVKGFDYYLSGNEIVNDAAYVNDLLLNLLDENINLQWIYKIEDKNDEFISNYEKSSVPPEDFKYIKENKIKSLKGKPIKNIKIYLFCTVNGLNLQTKSDSGILPKISGYVSGLFKANIPGAVNSASRNKAEADFNFIEKKFANIENNLSFISSRLNLELKRMNNQELTDYFYAELNPDRSAFVSSPEWENMSDGTTFRSQLIYSCAEIKRDYFYNDGYYYKFINMHKLPAHTDSFGITPLLNIKDAGSHGDQGMGAGISGIRRDFFPYDISVAFNIPEQEKTIEKMQADRNIKASLTEAVGGGYTDYKGVNITEQLDDFLESVSKMQKKIVEFSLCARIKSKNLEELNFRAVKLLESFKNYNGMEGIADNMEHHNLFLSFLPGQSRFNRRFKTSISSPASAFFPLHEGFEGTQRCAIPLINDRGEAVKLDLYNNPLPSKHGIVFGKTRSGKGFMLNGFLANFYISGENYHIIGVDIGGTYKKFCRIFNGDYIELDLDGNYCLNPFPPKKYAVKTVNGEEIFDPDIMVFLTGIIGLMVEPEKNLSPNDKTIITRAVQASYDRITDELDMPVISDINNILFDYNEARDVSDKKRALEMGKNMFQWTDVSSPYGMLLNRKNGIDINNKIVIFDLQKLKGHEDLQKVVFAIIKNISFKKMYDKSAKVFFFYDECWEFMNDPKISELITHLYKTSAKWGSMVWSITQEPGDLLKAGNAGKSIIENSSVKIFCQLDGDVSGSDLASCGLTEKEIGIIKNLKVVKGHYAEYFLKFGKDSAVIKNSPDPFEYWLCCKSSEDEEIEKKIEETYPDKSLKERLYILAEKYPNGPYGIKP